MKKLSIWFFCLSIFLFCLLIACNSTYRVKESSVSVSPVQKIQPEKKMEKLIEPYSLTMKEKMDEVIGEAEEDLEIGIPQGKLGNFVSDIMLNYSHDIIDANVEIALINNGGLRAPIRKGKITIGSIFELMPFDNQLVILTLPGNILDSLVSNICKNYINQNNIKSVFPFSGLNINLDKTGTYSFTVNGEAYRPSKNYQLVTTDYLAGGGDNLSILKQATASKQSGILLRDLLISRIRESKTLLKGDRSPTQEEVLRAEKTIRDNGLA